MMPRPRTLPDYACERCGAAFRSKDDSPRFCSRACYDADRREQSADRRALICPVCKRPFVQDDHLRSIYCSRTCFGFSQRIVEMQPCTVCGVLFKSYPSNPRIYCSQRCYSRARDGKIEKPCPHCGKMFTENKRNQRYCSRSCLYASSVYLKAHTCPQCGKNYKPRKDKIVFCSLRCCGLWQRGEYKRSGKNFTRAQRNAIKERDKCRCVVCHSTERLQVDHIVPVFEGGSPAIDNGQTMCRTCHRKKTTADIRRLLNAKLPQGDVETPC